MNYEKVMDRIRKNLEERTLESLEKDLKEMTKNLDATVEIVDIEQAGVYYDDVDGEAYSFIKDGVEKEDFIFEKIDNNDYIFNCFDTKENRYNINNDWRDLSYAS